MNETYYSINLMQEFDVLYRVVLTFKSKPNVWTHSNVRHWTVLSCDVYHTVQSGLNLEYVDEILKCDHSNERHWAIILSYGKVYYAIKGGL